MRPEDRDAIRNLRTGQSITITAEQGIDPGALRVKMSVAAQRAFGVGSYTTTVSSRSVTITRLAITTSAPVTVPPPANPDALLTRQQAVDYLRPRYFPQGLAVGTLRNLDSQGKGPEAIRNGQTVLYSVAALDAWGQNRLQPIRPKRAA